MRRISSGFFSAAYTSSDPNYIILFSIDPLKETMYEFVQTYSSVHFPKITKIGDEDKYGELISIYRIERLVQLIDAESNNMSWQRQQVMKTFSDLYSKLFYANYVNGRFQLKMPIYQRFERWMEQLENDTNLSKYTEPLGKQFEFYYDWYCEELAFDFDERNISVRPRQHDLVFSDVWALRYLCDNDYYRLKRNFPDSLLRSIYSE